MPKPYDATLKDLIKAYPADWLDVAGMPRVGPIEVLSADLSTVTAAADTLIRVGDAIIHLEVESGPDPSLSTRVLMYNVLAHRETGWPVHTLVVLLRPNANAGGLTNEIRYSVRNEGELLFRFEILRIWEVPVDQTLAGGIGILPLAVLSRVPPGQTREQAIPGIIERVAERAIDVLSPKNAALITASTLILAGMYLTYDQIREASLRLPAMIETVTFRVWENMGREMQLRDTLLALGKAKFGDPTPEQEQRLHAISNLDRLNRMVVAILKARSWAALLRTR